MVFDDPFYAEANTSYAVVLLTNSTNCKVRTATLGKTGRHGIITRARHMPQVCCWKAPTPRPGHRSTGPI